MDPKAEIIQALDAAMPGVSVLPAYPEDWAQAPCIVVEMAAEEGGASADDAEYSTVYEYYLRIYGHTQSEVTDAASQAQAVMRGLGYRRTFAWEDNSGEIPAQVRRYRTTKIYQGDD
jgi:hypothetical protein